MKNKWLFGISIFVNIVFVLLFLFNRMNSPSGELGVLKTDVKVGIFKGDSSLIYYPKELPLEINLNEVWGRSGNLKIIALKSLL